MNLFFLCGGLTVRRPSWRQLGGCHRGKRGLVRTMAQNANGLTASIRGRDCLDWDSNYGQPGTNQMVAGKPDSPSKMAVENGTIAQTIPQPIHMMLG
jgi:hypothetical protein